MIKLFLMFMLGLLLSGCGMSRHGLSGAGSCGSMNYGGYRYRDPLLRVRPNKYGLGVGSDQYGRPVRYEACY